MVSRAWGGHPRRASSPDPLIGCIEAEPQGMVEGFARPFQAKEQHVVKPRDERTPGTREGNVTFIVAESGKRNAQHVVLVIFRGSPGGLSFGPREGVSKGQV